MSLSEGLTTYLLYIVGFGAIGAVAGGLLGHFLAQSKIC